MFKSGQILQHRKNKALIRILRPHSLYGHEVLTSYFYVSMSDAISFENYEPASFLKWVETTLPHIKEQYYRRKRNDQPILLWLLKTIQQAYLPILNFS